MEIQKKYIEINNKKMAVIDEGSGESIIFLHGNPSSSYSVSYTHLRAHETR